MHRHVILTFIGVVVGIGLVVWVRPQTSGGTTFLIVISMLAANAVAAILGVAGKSDDKPEGNAKKADGTGLKEGEGP